MGAEQWDARKKARGTGRDRALPAPCYAGRAEDRQAVKFTAARSSSGASASAHRLTSESISLPHAAQPGRRRRANSSRYGPGEHRSMIAKISSGL